MNQPVHTLSPESEYTANFTLVFWETVPNIVADDTDDEEARRVGLSQEAEMRQWRDAAVDAFWLTEADR